MWPTFSKSLCGLIPCTHGHKNNLIYFWAPVGPASLCNVKQKLMALHCQESWGKREWSWGGNSPPELKWFLWLSTFTPWSLHTRASPGALFWSHLSKSRSVLAGSVSVVAEQPPQLLREVTSPLTAWLDPAHVCDYGKKLDACGRFSIVWATPKPNPKATPLSPRPGAALWALGRGLCHWGVGDRAGVMCRAGWQRVLQGEPVPGGRAVQAAPAPHTQTDRQTQTHRDINTHTHRLLEEKMRLENTACIWTQQGPAPPTRRCGTDPSSSSTLKKKLKIKI